MKQFTRLAATLLLVLAATSFFAGCEHESVQPQPGGTEPPRDTTSTTWTPDDWVDLGLPSGLLWAKRNVGATSPEDFGHYFAWGETSPKQAYSWYTYRYCNGYNNLLTKYCFDSEFGDNGFTDTLTRLQPQDDAAKATCGGRIPTKEEWQELFDNVVSTNWTTQNGVPGRIIFGPSGESLFLPAAGFIELNLLQRDGRFCYYWANSIRERYSPDYASCLSTSKDHVLVSYLPRNYGAPIRAVRSPR